MSTRNVNKSSGMSSNSVKELSTANINKILVQQPSNREPTVKGANNQSKNTLVKTHNDAATRRENDSWKTDQKKQKKPAVYGLKEEVKDKKAPSAARAYRTWHLYVGNLSLHMSAEEVKEFLESNGIIAVSCETVPNTLWQERFSEAMPCGGKIR